MKKLLIGLLVVTSFKGIAKEVSAFKDVKMSIMNSTDLDAQSANIISIPATGENAVSLMSAAMSESGIVTAYGECYFVPENTMVVEDKQGKIMGKIADGIFYVSEVYNGLFKAMNRVNELERSNPKGRSSVKYGMPLTSDRSNKETKKEKKVRKQKRYSTKYGMPLMRNTSKKE